MSDKISEFPSVECIFGLLDKWRHLPEYQLERRADIFFALFLPEVLKEHCDIKIKDPFIPEFPFDKKPKINKYRQADYFVLSENRQRGILVELKTDMASKRSKKGKEQEKALVEATKNKNGLKGIVEDFIAIIQSTKDKQARQKYIHLLSYMRKLELVCYDEEDLYKMAFAPRSTGISKYLENEVEPASWIGANKPELEVLYIQPEEEKYDQKEITALDFKTFASDVKGGKGNKEMRQLFAKYLSCWACTKAGSADPRDLPS